MQRNAQAVTSFGPPGVRYLGTINRLGMSPPGSEAEPFNFAINSHMDQNILVPLAGQAIRSPDLAKQGAELMAPPSHAPDRADN